MSRKNTPHQPIEAESETSPHLTTSLDNYIGYALRRAQLATFQKLVNDLEPFDIRPAQFTALSIINSTPGLMQADLARALNIEPPQLVPLLNKLENRGLAVRVRCKPDKRSYGLFLSKTGETLLRQLKETTLSSDRQATANLNDEERSQLLELLKKIYRDSGTY